MKYIFLVFSFLISLNCLSQSPSKWGTVSVFTQQRVDGYYKTVIDSLTLRVHILEAEKTLIDVRRLTLEGLKNIRHDLIIRGRFRKAKILKKLICHYGKQHQK